MPDLRKDPIVGRWVIIATSRASRPHDFDSTPTRHHGRFCPFCEGNETATPNEIIAYRKPGSSPNRPGWRVRAIGIYTAFTILKLINRGELPLTIVIFLSCKLLVAPAI